MIAPPDRLALLARMEAAHRETRLHLDLIHRQIAAHAERTTITEKAQARSYGRSSSQWTRSDELLFQEHVERLTFERRHEIESPSRKLDLPAVTADRAWAGITEEVGVTVVLIR